MLLPELLKAEPALMLEKECKLLPSKSNFQNPNFKCQKSRHPKGDGFWNYIWNEGRPLPGIKKERRRIRWDRPAFDDDCFTMVCKAGLVAFCIGSDFCDIDHRLSNLNPLIFWTKCFEFALKGYSATKGEFQVTIP